MLFVCLLCLAHSGRISHFDFNSLVGPADAFDHLDAPVERVCGADIPMPYAKSLEALVLPKSDDVLKAARRALYRGKK